MNLELRIKAARLRLRMSPMTTLTVAAVREAYGNASRAAHPDHGGDGNLAKIKKDRDFLLRHCEQREVCPHCGGSGYV